MNGGSPDIILKLFDTLKESTDKNERTMQILINQQQSLVESVTHLPIGEIRQEIKEHVISAKAERENIEDKIDKIDHKVAKMIVVVLVAFTILGGGWFYTKNDQTPVVVNQGQTNKK
jgi:molybdopterin biosynthesis enzyme MoaB